MPDLPTTIAMPADISEEMRCGRWQEEEMGGL